MLNFPVAYLLLKMGYAPETTMAAAIVIALMCLTTRLYMLRRMVQLPVRYFLRHTVLNVLVVSMVSCIMPFLLTFFLAESLGRFFFVVSVSFLSVAITVYFVGCTHAEREFVQIKAAQLIKKWKSK